MDAHPPLPHVLRVGLQGIADGSALFFLRRFLSGCVPWNFLLLSQKVPSPSPGAMLSSGPQSHSVVRLLVTWWSGC